MKRLIRLLILGVFIVIAFEFILGFVKNGHETTYKIITDNNEFNIKEVYKRSIKTENKTNLDLNNYYFEISLNTDKDNVFSFKTFTDYNDHKMIIKDIEYYKDDNIKCIYPIFKNHKNNIDILCIKDNILIDYKQLKGTNNGLDQFANNLINQDYDLKAWHKYDETVKKRGDYNIYTHNLLENDYLILWKYNGIYIENKNKKDEVEVFSKEYYDNNLGVLVNNYYVIPNYDQQYDFSQINVINVLSGNIKEIDIDQKISYDSYIEGIIDNKLYLFDIENKKQYEIDIDSKKVKEIGNENINYKKYDGNWIETTLSDIIQNKPIFGFKYEIPDNIKAYNYYRLDEVLGETDGYFYFYTKEGNNTKVYRVDKQNTKYVKLLFTINDISNIHYIEDYLYFVSKDKIYYYQDELGIVPIAENFEYLFNKNNMYDIYKK
jgi:hypothetical protein